MKKILFLLVTCIFIFASCGDEKQFDEDLRDAYHKTGKTFIASRYICVQISETWRKAIYERVTPSGKSCDDFNEALAELFTQYRDSGYFDSISNYKESMQIATSKLNNPPYKRKDCYYDFVNIVSDVSSMARMANDPSGTYEKYSNKVTETAEQISKEIDLFRIHYAQFFIEKDK